MSIEYARLPSPVGILHLYARNDVLCALSFDAPGNERSRREEAALARRFPAETTRETPDPAGVASALQRYFDGDLRALDGLRVDPGGTPFQASVWQALRGIAPGTTISYMELARRIGAADAVRAVGAANGANPIAIVIPCHRVIGANGKLVGYGGGLDRKRWLLEHEQGRPALFSR
jgi:methylated-DNA-[protein]-cysteine S-methyltransferase